MKTKPIFPGSAPIHCWLVSSNVELCRGMAKESCGWSKPFLSTIPSFWHLLCYKMGLPSSCGHSLNPVLRCGQWGNTCNIMQHLLLCSEFFLFSFSLYFFPSSSDCLALSPSLKFLSQRSHHLSLWWICWSHMKSYASSMRQLQPLLKWVAPAPPLHMHPTQTWSRHISHLYTGKGIFEYGL